MKKRKELLLKWGGNSQRENKTYRQSNETKEGLISGSKAVADVALKTTAINTLSGAVDAAAKDVATKAIKGESQDEKGTLGKALGGAASALVFSGATQKIIAGGTKTATTTFSNQWFDAGTDIFQPSWAGSVGVMGENIIPQVLDINKSIKEANNE